MATKFWVGGTGTWDASDTTHWANGSNGAGGQTVPVSGDTVTFDASSGGGTVTVNTNVNVTSITMGAFTGTLDFSANNNTVQVVTFSGTGTGTRTLNMGSGAWTVTGNATTVWNIGTATNMTLNGASADVSFNYSSNVGTRTISQTQTGLVGMNLPSFKITAGADIISGNFHCRSLNFTGFSGNWTSKPTQSIYGDFTIPLGMTIDASNSATTMAATSGTKIITSAINLDFPITIDGVGGTFQLGGALSMSSTRGLTLTNGTFDANGNSVTCGTFVSNNSNTRTLTMGLGTWTLKGSNTTIWNVDNGTGLILNANASTIDCTYSGSTGTRTINNSISNSVNLALNNLKISAGTDIVRIGGSIGSFNNVDFTGFTGTLTTNTGSGISMFGNLTLGTGMTVTASTSRTYTFKATSGTQTITSNSVIFGYNITEDGVGGTLSPADSLSLVTGTTITLTNGTFNANNQTVTAGAFSSSNSNTRVLTMGSGLWTLSSTGVVWTTVTTSGLTFNKNAANISITDTSSSSKTFSGGGLTYNNLSITGAGTGAVIIIGSNTFATFTIGAPKTVTFTAATTQTLADLSATGSNGNIITINTDVPGTQATLTKSSGNIVCDYLNLTDSNATGGANWYAGINSTDTSNNNGWVFAGVLPTTGPDSSGFSTGSPAIVYWLERNASTHVAGRTPQEAWHSFLMSQMGMDDTTLGLERAWLVKRIVALGGAGTDNNRHDLWMRYLALKDFAPGTLDDRFAKWITSGGI